MKTHRIHHQSSELGTAWFVVPLMWAAVALVGCAVIANWPGLFGDEPRDPASASVTQAAASVTPQEQP